MAVDQINTMLLRESGRFHQDILQRTTQISPWLDMVEEGAWPEGMGYAVNVTQFGRTLPAASNTYANGGNIANPAYDSTYWTDVGTGGLDTTTTNNCTPPTLNLRMGSKKVSFNLQHMALESERFCATDLLSAFEGPRQFEAIKENLATNTQFILTEKYRRDYVYWCDNKTVVTLGANPTTSTSAGGISGAANFNTGTSIQTAGAAGPGTLTNGLLQNLYVRLGLNGAGRNALAKQDGAPVYGLICSQETSRRIKVETDYRTDWRESSRSDELLKAIGAVGPSILGFQHIIDITPPRWNYVAGAWVKVEPYYVVTAPNGGYMIEENPSYLTALWEDSIIFHMDVMKMCFPGSVGNMSGTGFTPVNYRGAWSWRNIPDETKNPDGDVGYFRGRFMLGAMPMYTNYGWIVRHARCDASPQYAACA